MGEATTNERKGKTMGYESRLHVVNKTDMMITVYKNGNTETRSERKWGELLATFNLCKLSGECYPLWSGEATDCTFFDGNEYVLEDCYGDPLTENTVEFTIAMLKAAERTEHYRRLQPVIDYLRGLDLSEWDNVVVLHYGY